MNVQPNIAESVIRGIEEAGALDGAGETVGKRVREAIPAGPVKDAISGTWLGHALHPLLTDVVIGSFFSATLLDLLGGDDTSRASERLIAIGIAAYAPTALTGVSDWADAEPGNDGVRRVGLAHAITNSTALSLYAASLKLRRGGARRLGVALGLGGAAALAAAAYLGGHLTLAQGIGADQTVFDPGPQEWTAAVDASQLVEGRPTRSIVDDTPVLVVRQDGRLRAIHDRCSHRGCSLADGELECDQVVCPCHGSRFRLEDGSITRGPATAPQPAFEAREREGRIEVRRRARATHAGASQS